MEHKKITDVRLVPMEATDLELLMAWRSHPLIYQYFEQQSQPLTWNEHYTFWKNRRFREDFIIHAKNDKIWRKVGSINVSKLNTTEPEIGILIGELTLQRQGVGSKAVTLIMAWLKKSGFSQARVSVHRENQASQKLFTKHGFIEQKPTYISYVCQLTR